MYFTPKVKYDRKLQNVESWSKENYILNKYIILVKTEVEYYLTVGLADPFSRILRTITILL